MLELSEMSQTARQALRQIEIDAKQRTGMTQTGASLRLQRAAYGSATDFGDIATVGIGGITLGDGVGFLTRKYGLTINDLLGSARGHQAPL